MKETTIITTVEITEVHKEANDCFAIDKDAVRKGVSDILMDVLSADSVVVTNVQQFDMDWKESCRLRLLWDFEGSFFNERDEFIAHRYSNTYFLFGNCESELDVKCKVLEWLSRSAHKGMPYSQEWRNKKFRKFMLDGINMFLGTNFSFDDIEIIYTYLGNACNHKRTIQFIESGYDVQALKQMGE